MKIPIDFNELKSYLMQSHPLSDTNPELVILESPGIQDYRIENWRLSRAGGKVIIGAHDFTWSDLSMLVVFLYFKVSWVDLLTTSWGLIYSHHRPKAVSGCPLHLVCWWY